MSAFNTLYSVLYELSKVMAPFAPFLSEHLYRELSAFSEDKADKKSVHCVDFLSLIWTRRLRGPLSCG
ncbi:MAG: hypothetical protein Ct9H90mP27_1410 [Gammaproteobacteria bacterium]|nr:MAG: hypothetical protein Ct9H90mP27_1410 [Gammaproteobacteria bacterium]